MIFIKLIKFFLAKYFGKPLTKLNSYSNSCYK